MNPIRLRAGILLLALLAQPAVADTVSFDPPGSTFTMPLSMNDHGAVTGYWGGSPAKGFVREPDGTFAMFDPPGSLETTPLGINNHGVIVGSYKDNADGFPHQHGFVRRPNGIIVSYDAPGSIDYTVIQAVNDKRSFTGYYRDRNDDTHGFLQDAAGHFASFDVAGSLDTFGWHVNDEGAVTGYYAYLGHQGPCGNLYFGGFVRAPDGTITAFNVGDGEVAKSINAHGSVAGQYGDRGCHEHGFVRNADGTIKKFGYLGADCCTYVSGINNRGTIVGNYIDAQNAVHAYRRTRDGTFTLLEPDQRPKSETTAADINNSGQILGTYADHDGLHGFIYTP